MPQRPSTLPAWVPPVGPSPPKRPIEPVASHLTDADWQTAKPFTEDDWTAAKPIDTRGSIARGLSGLAEGSGASMLTPSGAKETIKGLINLATTPSRWPEAAFNIGVAPPLKLFDPQTRRAVTNEVSRFLGAGGPSADPLDPLRALEVLPGIGPNYTQARKEIEGGNIAGGLGRAIGTTGAAVVGAPGTVPRVTEMATAVAGPLRRGAERIAGATLDTSNLPAVRTALDEGLLQWGPQAGQRRAGTLIGETEQGIRDTIAQAAASGNPEARLIAAERQAAVAAAARAREQAEIHARKATRNPRSADKVTYYTKTAGEAGERLGRSLPEATPEMTRLGELSRARTMLEQAPRPRPLSLGTIAGTGLGAVLPAPLNVAVPTAMLAPQVARRFAPSAAHYTSRVAGGINRAGQTFDQFARRISPEMLRAAILGQLALPENER